MNGLSSNPFSNGNIVPITNPEPNSLDTKERSQLTPTKKKQDLAKTAEKLKEEAFKKLLDSIEIKENCSPTKEQVEKIFGCGEVDFIAKGSFGTVYKTKKKYPTAIKVGVRSKESYNAFVKEILAYLDIQENGGSPNIVEMLWHGQHNDCPLMELSSDEHVADLFKFFPTGGLNPFYAKLILSGTLEGLKFLHKIGRVHADIKPNNLLICCSKTYAKCVITDLGNSHKIDTSSEGEKNTTHQQGNVFYRDPGAIFTGKITPKSDLWALGMVIYTLICRKPFSMPSQAKYPEKLNTVGIPSPGQQRLLFQTIHQRFEKTEQEKLDELIPESAKKWRNFRIFLNQQLPNLWKDHPRFQRFSKKSYEEKNTTVKGVDFVPILNALFLPFEEKNAASSILEKFKILD